MSRPWKREAVGETLFALTVSGSFAYALIEAQDWALNAALFPLLIATPGLVLGLAVSLQTVMRARRPDQPNPSERAGRSADISLDQELLSARALVRTAVIFAWILGLLACVWLLGQKIALPLFVFLYLKTSGERWLPTLLLTLATIGFLLGVFDQVIHVAWHDRALFRWLGWDPL